MKKYLWVIIGLIVNGCSHGTVGFRNSNYKEIPVLPMNQYLAKELGPGSTVTVLEGPNEELKLQGSGGQFGAYSPFGDRWDFDTTVAFETYNDVEYHLQYQTNNGSGTTRLRYSVTGVGIDLAVGYRPWNWLRPYLGLRRDTYTLTPTNLMLGMSSTAVSNLFGFAGVEFTFPIAGNTGLSLKADYASSLTKDKNTQSADKTTLQFNVIWGLGKR